jgi:hypothetical protein
MDAASFAKGSRTKMIDFAAAWALYPRKVNRKDAERAWVRLPHASQSAAMDALPTHVLYWSATGTEKEFIPHFSTWINGERWTDELEMPKPDHGKDWMKSTAGVEAKAREMGMWPPKPGEDWHSLKARILAKAA